MLNSAFYYICFYFLLKFIEGDKWLFSLNAVDFVLFPILSIKLEYQETDSGFNCYKLDLIEFHILKI